MKDLKQHTTTAKVRTIPTSGSARRRAKVNARRRWASADLRDGATAEDRERFDDAVAAHDYCDQAEVAS